MDTVQLGYLGTLALGGFTNQQESKMAIKTYSFEDGKYQLSRNTDSGLITDARRHGDHWPAGLQGFQFSKIVHCMLNRIDELEALSVTNVLLDVVPGEDHEHEVYADSVNAVVEMMSAMGLRNEDLEGELVTARAALQEAATLLRKYETYHRAKGTEESTAKAEVNAEVAGRFEQIIGRTR